MFCKHQLGYAKDPNDSPNHHRKEVRPPPVGHHGNPTPPVCHHGNQRNVEDGRAAVLPELSIGTTRAPSRHGKGTVKEPLRGGGGDPPSVCSWIGLLVLGDEAVIGQRCDDITFFPSCFQVQSVTQSAVGPELLPGEGCDWWSRRHWSPPDPR